ncbi:MAG TPA: phosphatidylserine/phosphatidylglycerophosphate/cardiolipin synthase family protein [Gemmataceae bacterium]|nr:phosphatidylserine/phosphatidylglycerophosphate/cardiolipin synthase family protein [Gemmataceae bacterium]
MTTQGRGRLDRHLVVRSSWLPAALLLLSGCQVSPAKPSGCTPATADAKRSHVLARQILCDTGAEIVHHPLRAGRTVLADQAAWLGSASRGIFGKRLGMRLHAVPPLCPCPEGIDPSLIEAGLQPAAVQLYRDGGEALGVLEQMIDSAQCSIDVIIYIWEEDALGWSVARHLAARASPTRRVRILIDGGANLIFAPSPATDPPPGAPPSTPSRQEKPKTAGEVNRVVCWLAQQPCVELVRIRNPCAHFDHRKLVLIDGRCAWAGGRNFTQPGFFVRHDLTFTMQGPLVAEWQTMFESYWREQGGKPACLPPCPAGKPDLPANAEGYLVENAPTHHSLRRALYHAIDRARGFVYLENPYLTDNGVITKLARARRRGVDVRILFTIQSDSPSINHTNKVTANRLLAAGVRVYLYPGRVHTKAALVDGCWAYLGSGNFDLLSLHRNHELGVVFGPGPIIRDIDQVLFQPDFNPSWELHAPLPLTVQDYAYEILAAFFL